MIIINANHYDGKIIPSRELTPDEKKNVIGMVFVNTDYFYYEKGEEILLEAQINLVTGQDFNII